jgi:hypothetical protein
MGVGVERGTYGQGQVTSCCEDGNEPCRSIKYEKSVDRLRRYEALMLGI